VPETNAFLSLHLWDLRAQVEAQLRCLTTVQRINDNLPAGGDARRAHDRGRMIADLRDILRASDAIRAVCEQALEQAESLPD
jgi:hypothetical protein